MSQTVPCSQPKQHCMYHIHSPPRRFAWREEKQGSPACDNCHDGKLLLERQRRGLRKFAYSTQHTYDITKKCLAFDICSYDTTTDHRKSKSKADPNDNQQRTMVRSLTSTLRLIGRLRSRPVGLVDRYWPGPYGTATQSARTRGVASRTPPRPDASLFARVTGNFSSILSKSQSEVQNLTLEEKEARLDKILQSSQDLDEIAAQLTRQDFALVLQQLEEDAKTIPGCAVKAERWLGRMERLADSLHESSSEHFARLVPDATCYRHVIQAWANSPNEKQTISIPRAQRWLMKHMNSHVEIQRPTTASFNAFLDAVSRGRGRRSRHHFHRTVKEHAKLARETLEIMIADRKKNKQFSRIAPNTESFNYVLRAWTRCRESEAVYEKTMEVLQYLEKYEREEDLSVSPDIKSYGMILDSINCIIAQKVKRCQNPNDVHSNGKEEVELVKSVVKLMEAGKTPVAPTVTIYNLIIASYVQLARIHPDWAPFEAERILQQLIREADKGNKALRPDATSYLLVMRAWRNSRLPQRNMRVAYWLDTQWKDYGFDGNRESRPTTEGYNVVIRTFGETDSPELADGYFRAMVEKGAIEESRKLQPNTESFSFIIQAWVRAAKKSMSLDALKKAVRWMRHADQLEKSGDPIVRTQKDWYGTVLGGAHNITRCYPMETLILAVDVFSDMQESYHQVGAMEYTRILQIGLLALSRAENNSARTNFMRRIVKKCAEAGLVSGPFVTVLSNGQVFKDGWTVEESERVVQELFPWPFPASWSRNINDPKMLPKKRDLRRVYTETTPHEWVPPSQRPSRGEKSDLT